MHEFNLHTIKTTPAESAPCLLKNKQEIGSNPNLISVLAESSPTIDAYLKLNNLFCNTSFSLVERQVILLTINRFSDYQYCSSTQGIMPRMQKISGEQVAAIIYGHPITDHKLEALRIFTHTIVEKQGQLENWDLTSFYQAGYEKQQVLEIILGISFMTLNKYVCNIYDTPMDSLYKESKSTLKLSTHAA